MTCVSGPYSFFANNITGQILKKVVINDKNCGSPTKLNVPSGISSFCSKYCNEEVFHPLTIFVDITGLGNETITQQIISLTEGNYNTIKIQMMKIKNRTGFDGTFFVKTIKKYNEWTSINNLFCNNLGDILLCYGTTDVSISPSDIEYIYPPKLYFHNNSNNKDYLIIDSINVMINAVNLPNMNDYNLYTINVTYNSSTDTCSFTAITPAPTQTPTSTPTSAPTYCDFWSGNCPTITPIVRSLRNEKEEKV